MPGAWCVMRRRDWWHRHRAGVPIGCGCSGSDGTCAGRSVLIHLFLFQCSLFSVGSTRSLSHASFCAAESVRCQSLRPSVPLPLPLARSLLSFPDHHALAWRSRGGGQFADGTTSPTHPPGHWHAVTKALPPETPQSLEPLTRQMNPPGFVEIQQRQRISPTRGLGASE
eukprot:2532878-Rhodomonas_salina.2